jgi:hypothetical protein
MSDMPDDWTTQKLVDEATRRGRRVSRQHVHRLCQLGTIKARHPGRDWLIDPRDAEDWLKRWLGEK